jgi:hypothetical protein
MISVSALRLTIEVLCFISLLCLLLVVTPNAFLAPEKGTQKPVTVDAPEQVDKVAEVQIKSALKILREGRSGVIYVIIRNISNVPIKVQDVIITVDTANPDASIPEQNNFIKFMLTGLEWDKELLPQQSQKLRIDVEAKGQIEEGQHLLLVEVVIQWNRDNKPLTRSLFASQDFNVEVLAASGILSVLGVSSILFLPGFLGVAVFIVLQRLWDKYWKGEKWQLDLKSPESWVLVLTISIPALLLYPVLSLWWFGDRRNLLKGYGMPDIALLWFASIIAAVLIWIIITGVKWSIERYIKNHYQSRLESYEVSLKIKSTDTPTELLSKLAKRWDWQSRTFFSKLRFVSRRQSDEEPQPTHPSQRKVLTFPKDYPLPVEVKVDGVAESYFLVEPPKGEAAQVLVLPAIDYKYQEPKGQPAEVRAKFDQFESKLIAAIKAWDVGEIARLFEEGTNDKWLKVEWAKFSSNGGKVPRYVGKGQYTPRPDEIIRFFNQQRR